MKKKYSLLFKLMLLVYVCLVINSMVYAENNISNAFYVSTSACAIESSSVSVTIGEFVYGVWNGVQKWFKMSSMETINGADIAEMYKSTEKLVPGDVVSIDTNKDNSIVKTKIAEDTLVAGIISTTPGVLLNKTEKGYKVALVGKVPTKVCNEGGNIKRGDLLVSASLAGYAKKAGDNPKTGTVIGKALENFDSQKGTILVFVNLQ